MAKRPKSERSDVEALRAALSAAEARADEAQATAHRAEALAAAAVAKASSDTALIAHLRLEIARLTRTLYGQRSERTQRLIDQYELQLEELEASAAADALAAEKAAAKAAVPAPVDRRKPSRQPFPAQLPRVRVVVPAPTACPCCGDMRLSKMGEDVTETLEVVPRRWTVIQTVRERFSCRACESVS
jgi:transposase